MAVVIRTQGWVTCDHVTQKKTEDEPCGHALSVKNAVSCRDALNWVIEHHGYGIGSDGKIYCGDHIGRHRG